MQESADELVEAVRLVVRDQELRSGTTPVTAQAEIEAQMRVMSMETRKRLADIRRARYAQARSGESTGGSSASSATP